MFIYDELILWLLEPGYTVVGRLDVKHPMTGSKGQFTAPPIGPVVVAT